MLYSYQTEAYMKKIIVLLLIFSIAVPSLIFAANQQTTYTIRDEVYHRVDELCRRAGVLGPSSFTPLPARALLIAMERIDVNRLSAFDKAEYNDLMYILTGEEAYLYNDDYFSFDLGLNSTLKFNVAKYSDYDFGNTDSEEPQPDRRHDTLVPYRYEPALLSLSMDMDFGEHVALDARFDIKQNQKELYWSNFSGLLSGLAAELPYQAGASIGNKFFNLTLGRYPHSVGAGVTGNLLIGDNFNYQEVLLVSLMSNHFSYNISITRFDQMVSAEKNSAYADMSRHKFSKDQQFRVNHRFDLTLFDKVRIAANLATIYTSQYGFDFRFFYPFVLSHNYYNYANNTNIEDIDEANNLMTFEFEWTIAKGFTFTAQFALDQLQAPWENQASLPLAIGALANFKYSTDLNDGRLNLWLEAVYTNPYLYLNGKYNEDLTINEASYNLDYIVGYNMQYIDDYGYSGYVYGPDSVVLSLGGSYSNDEAGYEIGGSLLYKARGKKGLSHIVHSTNETWIDMSDAVIEKDSEDFMDNIIAPSGGWKNAEHLIRLMAYGTYRLPEYGWGQISFSGALGAFCYYNYNHTGNNEFLPQLSFSVSYVF